VRKPRLFHVSEEAGIVRFEPRPPPSPDAGVEGDAVWAVAQSHLVNFLTPRDCPRITFRAGPDTREADRARFLAGAERVVAFEQDWLDRVRTWTLYAYRLPAGAFRPHHAVGGYWVADQPVDAIDQVVIDDLPGRHAAARIELRVTPSIWPFWRRVTASTVEFSGSRLSNAGVPGP